MTGMSVSTGSRYGSGGNSLLGGNSTDNLVVTSPTSSNTQGTSQQVTNGSSNQTSVQNGSSTQKTVTNNFTPQQQALLDGLLKQLAAGGTPQMVEDRARRVQQAQQVQKSLLGYTKDAAFGDAQGAMAQMLRQAMEQSMPALVRASEASGTSSNALRALLIQQQQQNAAQAASALGLKAAVDYGGVSNGMNQILANLNQTDPTVANALMQALGIAKGGTSTSTTTGTTSNTTQTQGSTSQVTNGSTSETKNNSGGSVLTDYNPMTNGQVSSMPAGGLSYYGGGATPSLAGTTGVGYTQNNSQAIQQLLGGLTNSWDSVTF